MREPRKLRQAVAALLLLSGALSGCAQLRLPAIDQSGERILLPAPASTTLVAPALPACHLLSCCPEPAFVAPPEPPPCPPDFTPATCAPATAPADCAPAITTVAPPAGRAGSLVVAPGRMVAPVGSEVVLTAGFCGPDGYFVNCQPIEWLLSQDSVGHFVEVSDDGQALMPRLWRHSPGKLSGDYAKVHTGARAQVVTRGTPTPADDVLLQTGQTWISVTSATEGASHVTVVAPNAGPWDSRRRTATIHWVDAQWELPGPVIVRASQAQLLTTKVTRANGSAPSPPWLVRYEVVSGVPATFGPAGSASAEVPTDGEGRASVELQPAPGAAGGTQVRIQIIRPAAGSGDLPRTVVGQGWTTVTWSAPGLAVAVRGAQVASVGVPLAYQIQVANPGDLAAPQVTASLTLPPGMVLVNSDPPGEIFGNRVQWVLGDLPGKAARNVEVQLRAEREGDVRLRVEARGGDLRAEGEAPTRITAPSLTVKLTGPERAAVGEAARYQVEVSNIGQQRLSDVTVTDQFDEGLAQSEGQASPIVKGLGELAPGETKRFGVTFIVRRPGRHCHRLEAAAATGERASAQACLEAASPPARTQLQLSNVGPAELREGDAAQYLITVTNAGNTVLTNVRIADEWSPSLQPQRASPDFQLLGGQLVWTVSQLAPNESLTRQVNCLALRPDPRAVNRAVVTADQQVRETAEAVTRIVAAAAPPASPPGSSARGGLTDEDAPPQPPASGELRITVAETNNPVYVGEETTYLITVENDRDVSDKNVFLKIAIPQGMTYQAFNSSFAESPRFSADGRVLQTPPVAELRPREKLQPFQLRVVGASPGRWKLVVEAHSLRSPQSVIVERDTDVLARP